VTRVRLRIELALLMPNVLDIAAVTFGLRDVVGVIQVLLFDVGIDLVSCATDYLSSHALIFYAARNVEGIVCGVCRVGVRELMARILLIWPGY
jgi:hypothetical protein